MLRTSGCRAYTSQPHMAHVSQPAPSGILRRPLYASNRRGTRHRTLASTHPVQWPTHLKEAVVPPLPRSHTHALHRSSHKVDESRHYQLRSYGTCRAPHTKLAPRQELVIVQHAPWDPQLQSLPRSFASVTSKRVLPRGLSGTQPPAMHGHAHSSALPFKSHTGTTIGLYSHRSKQHACHQSRTHAKAHIVFVLLRPW